MLYLQGAGVFFTVFDANHFSPACSSAVNQYTLICIDICMAMSHGRANIDAVYDRSPMGAGDPQVVLTCTRPSHLWLLNTLTRDVSGLMSSNYQTSAATCPRLLFQFVAVPTHPVCSSLHLSIFCLWFTHCPSFPTCHFTPHLKDMIYTSAVVCLHHSPATYLRFSSPKN